MRVNGKMKTLLDFFYRYKKIKNEVILVYTMGKVGSSSIYYSILDNVAQIHSLDTEIPTKYFTSKDRSTWIGHLVSRIIWRSVIKRVRKCVVNSEKVKIITGVREPISRNISSYFQGMKVEELKNCNSDDILNEFYTVTNHTVPLYWFDCEIKRHLGIDIFDYNFDKEQGYTVLKSGKYEIFIYRIEDLDRVINEVEEFVGAHNFKYTKKNITNKKLKSDLLSNFKNNISFSKESIQAMYNSKYMNHFYSKAEIQEFEKKFIK